MSTISEFKLGQSIRGFFLCRKKSIRKTRANKLYLEMYFSDSTGSISAVMWDLVEEFNDKFEEGDPVALKGVITEYDKVLQISVTNINKATSDQYGRYGFTYENLIKKIDESIDALWKELFDNVSKMKSPLKQLVNKILKAYKIQIQSIPLSIENNNPIYGSYLKHLVDSVRIINNILPNYPNLDHNLVVAGTILYDIGRVKCFTGELIPQYTNESKVIGSMILSRDIIIEASKKFKSFPKEIISKLENIILLNKQNIDQNDLVDTHFLEGILIYHITQLDKNYNLKMEIHTL